MTETLTPRRYRIFCAHVVVDDERDAADVAAKIADALRDADIEPIGVGEVHSEDPASSARTKEEA